MIHINFMQYLNGTFDTAKFNYNAHFTTNLHCKGTLMSICSTTSRCISCSDICNCHQNVFVTFGDLAHFDYF